MGVWAYGCMGVGEPVSTPTHPHTHTAPQAARRFNSFRPAKPSPLSRAPAPRAIAPARRGELFPAGAGAGSGVRGMAASAGATGAAGAGGVTYTTFVAGAGQHATRWTGREA